MVVTLLVAMPRGDTLAMHQTKREELVAYYREMADEAEAVADNLMLNSEQFLRLARSWLSLAERAEQERPH